MVPQGASQFYGKGLESLFPEGSYPMTSAPFPRMARDKFRQDYDPALVHKAIANAPEPVAFDPRELRSTQPNVTRAGVAHYMQPGVHARGELFGDKNDPGNVNPIVYSRKECEECPEHHMILSGHHRATAALLEGRQFTAVQVRGGMGPSYK